MKNFLLLVVFLVLIQKQVAAQQVGWNWANSVAANYDTFGNGITTDAFGNVYVTGYAGTTFSLGATTYTGSGGIYIAKYNASGNVLWVKTAVGTQGSGGLGYGISTDANGNVFIAGQFSGPSLIFGTYTLTSNTIYNDMFIVKFDPNGTVLWAKSAGGTDSDVGKDISIDANGNAFVTGYFESPSLTFGTYTLNRLGQYNVFTVKYDPNGAVLWAKSGVGTNSSLWADGTTISADGNGNVLVGGFFRNSSLTFGTYTLTSLGSDDIFIVKYDLNGSVLWAKSAGGTLSDEGTAISTDSNGNAFLTGSFQSPSIAFGTYTLINGSSSNINIFVTKYDASGNVLWAEGLGLGQGAGICTNSSGNAFVTGYYNSTSIVFGTSTLTSNGAADIFVVEYGALGNQLSSASAGGALDDYGKAIAVDGGGNVFVTGTYNSPSAIFGSATLNNSNTSYADVFVGKLGVLDVGILENGKINQKIKVFPNPSKDKIFFDIPFQDKFEIIISSTLGAKVSKIKDYTNLSPLDVSGLDNGVYFYNVRTKTNNYSGKFVKD